MPQFIMAAQAFVLTAVVNSPVDYAHGIALTDIIEHARALPA